MADADMRRTLCAQVEARNSQSLAEGIHAIPLWLLCLAAYMIPVSVGLHDHSARERSILSGNRQAYCLERALGTAQVTLLCSCMCAKFNMLAIL